VVRDAIETLAPEVGDKTLAELQELARGWLTTDEILKRARVAQAPA